MPQPFQRAANSQTQPKEGTQYVLNYSTALSAVPQQTDRERGGEVILSLSLYFFLPCVSSIIRGQLNELNTSFLINGDWYIYVTWTTYCILLLYCYLVWPVFNSFGKVYWLRVIKVDQTLQQSTQCDWNPEYTHLSLSISRSLYNILNIKFLFKGRLRPFTYFRVHCIQIR